MTPTATSLLAGALLAAAATALAACGQGTTVAAVPGGDPARGHDAIVSLGCGSCHMIGGVAGADGQVGPSLVDYRSLRYITGSLPTTPANTIRWIMDPQRYNPTTVMPDLGVGERQARDITAYLYGQ